MVLSMKEVMLMTKGVEKVRLFRRCQIKTATGKICLPNGTVVVGDWSGNKVSNASMHQGSSEDVPK